MRIDELEGRPPQLPQDGRLAKLRRQRRASATHRSSRASWCCSCWMARPALPHCRGNTRLAGASATWLATRSPAESGNVVARGLCGQGAAAEADQEAEAAAGGFIEGTGFFRVRVGGLGPAQRMKMVKPGCDGTLRQSSTLYFTRCRNTSFLA